MQNRSVYEASDRPEDTSGIATRVARITVSAIKQMPMLASRTGGCVSLGQGIPSLNTPEFIRNAIIEELKKEDSLIGKYSLQAGLPELKSELSRDLKRRKGIEVDAEEELFISCGGMESLAAAISTVIERGDEVILPSPTYASHIEQVLFAEGIPVFVRCREENGWQLDLDELQKAISRKTRAIVISNPVNPSGAVFAESRMRRLAQIALENKLMVINDEAYDFLVFDGAPYFSLTSIPELKDQLISVGSFSKRYCMTGWRIGYMHAPQRIIKQVLKVHDAFAICAPTISQYAALTALRATNGKDGDGDKAVEHLCSVLLARRELVCKRLEALTDHFSYVKPAGGYYLFPKILSGASSIEFALKILKEARVITIPGAAFGPFGEAHLRLSFGADEKELHEAFDRLENYFMKADNQKRTCK